MTINNLPLLPEKITFYVSLKENSTYAKSSFDAAKDFFREHVGIDIKFEYKKKEDIDFDSLDHRLRFAIIEDTVEEFAIDIGEALKKYLGAVYKKKKNGNPAEKKAEIEDLANNLTKYELNSIEKTGITSLSCNQFGSIYLFYQEGTYEFVCQMQEDVDYYKTHKKPNTKAEKKGLEKAKRGLKIYKKASTVTIIHEICHLAGLDHPDLFENDGMDYSVEKSVNIMEAKPSDEDFLKDFNLTQWQIDQLRDYFSGEKTYKDLESYEFNLGIYLMGKAKQNGWKIRNY